MSWSVQISQKVSLKAIDCKDKRRNLIENTSTPEKAFLHGDLHFLMLQNNSGLALGRVGSQGNSTFPTGEPQTLNWRRYNYCKYFHSSAEKEL